MTSHKVGAKDDVARGDFSVQWNCRHLGMEGPRDWHQRGPVSRPLGSWGKGATVMGLPSWNRGPGPGPVPGPSLSRRGASGYFARYQPPPQNLLYYSNPPPLFGDGYTSLGRVGTNRRQLDILSGLGGLLGGLPGKFSTTIRIS